MKKILITGSTGFIGQELLSHLTTNYKPIAVVRKPSATLPSDIRQIQIDNILPDTDWSSALSGIDAVIHLAARVHIMDDSNPNPLSEFRKINTFGTLNLARQAAAAGVRRFIFLSSIKVNGESTPTNIPFKARDSYIPTDPYGLSKYDAEQGLKDIASQTGLEIVIIRPPLVYGPNVKANFRSMMNWLNKGIPLPLGAIKNKRSLVALDNLIDLIKTCIDHQNASNQIFLVSDDEDLSTTELLRGVSKALGKPARLIPISANILTFGATLLGKSNIAHRLCSSLQIDISHTKKILNWNPPISVEKSLLKTAQAYLNEKTH